MARVALVNLPFQAGVEAVAQTSIGPPMGLAYIAAVLSGAGHDVLLPDANALRLTFDDIGRELRRFDPHVVGTTAATPSIHLAAELARLTKRLSARDVPVIVGGPHGAAAPDETLAAFPEIDVLVLGEGEAIADPLVRALTGQGSLEEIPGIAWRGGTTALPSTTVELDAMPFPARELLPNHLYRTIDSWPMTCMVAVRGCPARCVYCAVPVFSGREVRRRSAANVVAEMEQCLSRWNIPFFSFLDDTFSTSREWVVSLTAALKDAGLARRVSWSCLTRPDMVDEELLAAMKAAGCVRAEFGIESGSPRVLKILRKGATIEKIRAAFAMAHKVGLATLGFAMLNVPGETPEDIDMTERAVLEMDPLFLQLSFCTPYPGTWLHRHCVENDLLETTDWSEYRFLRRPVIRNPHMGAAELTARHARILKRFYLRPGKAAALARYALAHPRAAGSLARTSLDALWHLLRRAR